MALCLLPSRSSSRIQGKSHWTGQHSLRFAIRVLSSRCLHNSMGRTSSCATLTCTTFPSKNTTGKSETQATTDSRQLATGSLCADLHLRSRSAPPVSMNERNSQPYLVAIVGPTASGKSALGVWLAEKLGGEVVACDSTQLYRGFDIGTAKPDEAVRRSIPQHLIDR